MRTKEELRIHGRCKLAENDGTSCGASLDAPPAWTPWGWAVDQKRLLWLIFQGRFRNRKCFTCQFRAKYHRIRREVFPVLSRSQNAAATILAARDKIRSSCRRARSSSRSMC